MVDQEAREAENSNRRCIQKRPKWQPARGIRVRKPEGHEKLAAKYYNANMPLAKSSPPPERLNGAAVAGHREPGPGIRELIAEGAPGTAQANSRLRYARQLFGPRRSNQQPAGGHCQDLRKEAPVIVRLYAMV
jgi:hypothetical protein